MTDSGRASRFAVEPSGPKKVPTLGTFLGVFTPTLLTILGVIMYLRFGWVVGNVGLGGALAIVIVANLITLATTLSFSAIATNTRVGVGGAYFIISRSLGLQIGGAIGLPLFLSQVFSVTLYAFGLAETLKFVWPGVPIDIAAFVIIIGVGALSFKGADVALKTQVPIMVFVGISIVALALGLLTHEPLTTTLTEPLPPKVPFWGVFAIFFPAVTGVMAGLGLSGDLKDPRESIPKGSLTAAIVGLVLYICIVVVLALGADEATLITDQMIWSHMALGGALVIFPGLWGAIFSSAVGSILGAPRTLQALIQDHASPGGLMSKIGGDGSKEPVAGLVVSLIIALGAVFLGDLNAVAEVVTLFFLTVYGVVNIVAALETLSGSATWRPKLKVHWLVSLSAGIACFAVMFLINWAASLAAISIELVLWLMFQRWERDAEWGDMRRDIYEALIRWALLRLKRRPMHSRNWRPHILVFADQIERRLDLVRFSTWFSQERGVVTVCELMLGDVMDDGIDFHGRREHVNKTLDDHGIVAFGEVDVVPELNQGIIDVVQANGLAGLQSNAVMFGWPSEGKVATFLKLLPSFERLNKSVLIARLSPLSMASENRARLIHVWWGGLERNGDMMLLLAHFLTRNPQWRRARIEVMSIASNETVREETEQQLQKLLPETRIQAQHRVLLKPKEQSIREVIQRESATADVVFLGLATPAPGTEEEHAQRLEEMSSGLPSVVFVKNASLFVGKLV